MKKKNKGVLVTTVIVILAIAFASLYFLRGGTKSAHIKPSISVASLSLENINEESIDIEASVLVDNPLPFEINANRVDYQIQIDGVPVMTSRQDEPITIRSNTSSTVELPVKLLIDELSRVLEKMDEQQADSAAYTLSARIYIDFPIAGERTLNFSETKKLPAFRLLKVRTGDLSIDRLRWEKSSLTIAAQVKNPNDFAIRFKDVQYEVTLDDDHAMTGNIPGVTELPANTVVTVPVKLQTDNKALGRLVWKTLFDKDDTPFSLTYKSTLISKNDMLNNTPMMMKTEGTLADLKKLPPLSED